MFSGSSTLERRALAVDVAVDAAHPEVVIELVQVGAAAARVAGRKVEDRLPDQVAPVTTVELVLPLAAEDRPAALEERDPAGVVAGGRTVFVVHDLGIAGVERAESGPTGAQAVVGVLEVRLEVLREPADRAITARLR